VTTWLDGWEQVEGNDSGSWASGPTRPKLLLHTTEGSSIAGAVGAYKANNSWPHVTVDPIRKTRVQHVPLTKPARALRNSATPGETNRAPIVIQVEIVGRAAESHDWSEAALVWLGREVVGPLCTAASIPLVAPREFLGTKAGHTLASVTAKQRLTAAQWRDLSGIFGHQHAPENTHWDPGALNIGRIIQAAKGYGPLYPSTPTGPSTEDADMTAADRKLLEDALAEARAAGLRAAHCEQLLAEQAEQLKQFYGSLRGWSVAIAEKVGASREDAVRNDPHATKP